MGKKRKSNTIKDAIFRIHRNNERIRKSDEEFRKIMREKEKLKKLNLI